MSVTTPPAWHRAGPRTALALILTAALLRLRDAPAFRDLVETSRQLNHELAPAHRHA